MKRLILLTLGIIFTVSACYSQTSLRYRDSVVIKLYGDSASFYKPIQMRQNNILNVNKIVADTVVANESGGGGGASSFLDLDDTPNSYESQNLLLLRVNATANGVEFISGDNLYTPLGATVDSSKKVKSDYNLRRTVPAYTGLTAKFLREDSSWQTIAADSARAAFVADTLTSQNYSKINHNHTGTYEPAFGISTWSGTENVTTVGNLSSYKFRNKYAMKWLEVGGTRNDFNAADSGRLRIRFTDNNTPPAYSDSVAYLWLYGSAPTWYAPALSYSAGTSNMATAYFPTNGGTLMTTSDVADTAARAYWGTKLRGDADSALIADSVRSQNYSKINHAHAFTSLSDVPASYSGAGGYFVKVNSGMTGLEFVESGGGTNHNMLSSTHSDATARTPQAGALMKFGTTWDTLKAGVDGQFLKMVSGDAKWSNHGLTASDVGALGASDEAVRADSLDEFNITGTTNKITVNQNVGKNQHEITLPDSIYNSKITADYIHSRDVIKTGVTGISGGLVLHSGTGSILGTLSAPGLATSSKDWYLPNESGTISLTSHNHTGVYLPTGGTAAMSDSLYKYDILGTSNEIEVSAGPEVNQHTVGLTDSVYVTNVLRSPTLRGNIVYVGNAGLKTESATAGNYLTLYNGESFTGQRTLTLTTNNASRTIDLSGNLTIANNLTTSGNYAATFTFTNTTGVTFPTTGTLATTTDLGGYQPLDADLTTWGTNFYSRTTTVSDYFRFYEESDDGDNYWTVGIYDGNLPYSRNLVVPNNIADNDYYLPIASALTANTMFYGGGNNSPLGIIAAANSSVLVTSAGGIPSLSTSLPSGIGLTSPVITTDIRPVSAGGATLGTSSLPFSSLYIGSTANGYRITGTSPSAGRDVTLSDIGATGYIELLSATTTTANKIPLSTTTAGKQTYSTATYPSTATTATQYLSSDGTNWVARDLYDTLARTAVFGNSITADDSAVVFIADGAGYEIVGAWYYNTGGTSEDGNLIVRKYATGGTGATAVFSHDISDITDGNSHEETAATTALADGDVVKAVVDMTAGTATQLIIQVTIRKKK